MEIDGLDPCYKQKVSTDLLQVDLLRLIEKKMLLAGPRGEGVDCGDWLSNGPYLRALGSAIFSCSGRRLNFWRNRD